MNAPRSAASQSTSGGGPASPSELSVGHHIRKVIRDLLFDERPLTARLIIILAVGTVGRQLVVGVLVELYGGGEQYSRRVWNRALIVTAYWRQRAVTFIRMRHFVTHPQSPVRLPPFASRCSLKGHSTRQRRTCGLPALGRGGTQDLPFRPRGAHRRKHSTRPPKRGEAAACVPQDSMESILPGEHYFTLTFPLPSTLPQDTSTP